MDNSYNIKCIIKRGVSRVRVLVMPDMGCMRVYYSVWRPCVRLSLWVCMV